MKTSAVRDLRNRVYFGARPFLPQALRVRLRAWLARDVRRRHWRTWPIDPHAGVPLEDWEGWPHGYDCAFAITHDVEGPRGLANVRPLAELELELGFRSSFNFVPEGSYQVPATLRDWLVDHGFEVGVHDLHHDGRLYASRAEFQASAHRINHYLREWRAEGFRSAFMLSEPRWLDRLAISYDSSTFDTDPFEPEPAGVGTIFPFRVATDDGGACVELPYTLPQDSTLFLVLRETDPEIWKQKFDWIADRGGMALVNVHPDYLAFDGRRTSTRFPVAYYRAFLEHVSRSPARCWRALPRDIAAFCRQAELPTAA